MKKTQIFNLFIFLFIISCAIDLEMIKKKSDAIRNLGEAHMAQGNYTEALKQLLEAEKIYPLDALLQDDLGLVYLAKEKPDIAIGHFKKAISMKPDFAATKNNLGTAYLIKKEWDLAIKIFKEISEDLLYATPQYPLSNLGWAYYNKINYEEAEKYYKKAIDITPKFFIAWLGLGKTYIAMGKNKEAIETFEKAIQNAPQLAEAYFEIAKAYQLTGENDKAINSYKKVLELSKNSENVTSVFASNEIKRLEKK